MKYIISIVALAAIVVHALLPEIKIDVITIGLFVIGIIPWVSSLFEELEMPGGWKMKFKKTEEIARRADAAGLTEELTKEDENKYAYQKIISTDKNLALAGLRIEIEKKLKDLAEQNNIGTKMQGVGRMLQILSEKELIGLEERSVLSDMIGLLNEAVHGAKIDSKSFEWAIEYGTKILKSLEKKINLTTAST